MGAFDPPQDDFSKPTRQEKKTYVNDKRAANLCELFAEGLESGLGYGKVFEIMERQRVKGKSIELLRDYILEDGNLLAQAFNRLGLLDPPSRKLLLVAENQGTLPETFHKLSRYYQNRYERRKTFIGSLIEPLAMTLIGLVFFRNLLMGAFPTIIAAFQKGTFNITQSMIAILPSMKLAALESALTLLLFLSTAFVFLNLSTDSSLRRIAHRILLSLPYFGHPGRLQATATFCNYLQKSIMAGLSIERTLKLAAEASNYPKIMKSIENIQDMIKARGFTIAEALREARVFDVDVIEHIDIGEETGHLEERLDFVSHHYQTKADDASERLRTTISLSIRYLILVSVFFMVILQAIGLTKYLNV